MNSLVDADMIEHLYEASQAGVRDRPDRPRDLLSQTGNSRDQRPHQGDEHRRPLSGAFAHFLFRERWGRGALLRIGGLDAAELRSPGGSHRSDIETGGCIRGSARCWKPALRTTGRRGICTRTAPTSRESRARIRRYGRTSACWRIPGGYSRYRRRKRMARQRTGSFSTSWSILNRPCRPRPRRSGPSHRAPRFPRGLRRPQREDSTYGSLPITPVAGWKTGGPAPR